MPNDFDFKDILPPGGAFHRRRQCESNDSQPRKENTMADSNTPTPHEKEHGDGKPVIWTPEDASRFLTSAIHEAQRPLADALQQRPVTSKALALIVAILVVAAMIIASLLSSQAQKWEKAAQAAQTAKDEALVNGAQLQSRSEQLELRLNEARSLQEKLQQEASGMRENAEELKRAKGDAQRFRRQNELLRSQIAGLEMEREALAKQLAAVRALAMEEDGGYYDDDGSEATENAADATADEPKADAKDAPAPARPENAVADVPAAKIGSAVSTSADAEQPKSTITLRPVDEPKSASSSDKNASEQQGTASVAAKTNESAGDASEMRVMTVTPTPAVETVTVEMNPPVDLPADSATGDAAENKAVTITGNPPTLYESSLISEDAMPTYTDDSGEKIDVKPPVEPEKSAEEEKRQNEDGSAEEQKAEQETTETDESVTASTESAEENAAETVDPETDKPSDASAETNADLAE